MKNSTNELKSNRCRVLADMIDRWHREISDARVAARAARNSLVRARGEVNRLQNRIERLEAALVSAGAAGRTLPPGLPRAGATASSVAARADLVLARQRLEEAKNEVRRAEYESDAWERDIEAIQNNINGALAERRQLNCAP